MKPGVHASIAIPCNVHGRIGGVHWMGEGSSVMTGERERTFEVLRMMDLPHGASAGALLAWPRAAIQLRLNRSGQTHEPAGSSTGAGKQAV